MLLAILQYLRRLTVLLRSFARHTPAVVNSFPV